MLSLKVEGKIYKNFKEISVMRTLNSISSAFRIVSPTNTNVFPIKRGDAIEIITDTGNTILTGYVDRISVKGDKDSHDIELFGTSALQDLVDSSVKDDTNFKGPLSLKQLIERVLTQLNLSKVKVIDEVKTLDKFADKELMIGSKNESAYQFLQSFARKRQVFLKTGIDGNLYIVRGFNGTLSGQLFNIVNDSNRINNVLEYQFSSDQSKLFNTYKINSELNPASDDDETYLKTKDSGQADIDSITNFTAEVEDGDIRDSRYLEISAEENTKQADMQKRINWEQNIRKSNSEVYTATIQGHTLNNEDIETNYLMNVKDDLCGIDKQLLVKSVEYMYSLEGSKTRIECVNKDAFTLEPLTPEKNKEEKKSNLANEVVKTINRKRGDPIINDPDPVGE